jgi:glycosyltransferase involved in cell wall biosynthesis
VSALKWPLLAWYFAGCDAFITIGDNNEGYYRRYGVPEEKLFRGSYPIDLARFRSALAAPARPARTELRRRYGVPEGGFVAVMAGKLEPRKRPLDLVEAIALLGTAGVEATALFVGDGPLRPELERRAAELGISERVRVTGFVNQAEIPWVLDAGDVLVSASEVDPHPLAVSEGMAVGLPVIVSDRVGCVGPTDSARPGVNALVYRCGDTVDLAARLKELALDPVLRTRMSAASRTLAPTQDLSVCADAVLRAIAALRPRFRDLWADVSDETFDLLARRPALEVVPRQANA